jgi:endonuclease G
MRLPTSVIQAAESVSPKTAEETAKFIDTARKFASDRLADFRTRRATARMRMLGASASEAEADAFERYVGDNDLLPINYLMIGHQQSRSVGRIGYYDLRQGRPGAATGFLVSHDLVITNHHVFEVPDATELERRFRDPIFELNCEYDVDGRECKSIVFQLDPARFFHSYPQLDLALVAVKPLDVTGAHAVRDYGYLVLNGNLGKAATGEFATIIQHPEGGSKQIAIRKNEIIDITHAEALVYASDTARGSSGAPVFNDQWQVIALHSAGVAKKNAQGQYVDRDGNVIESADGYVDAERIVWLSNRGIRVSAIMTYLAATPLVRDEPLVAALFAPSYSDARPYLFLSRPVAPEESMPASRQVAAPVASTPIVAPVGAPVEIRITIGDRGVVVSGDARKLGPIDPAKENYEDDLDFDACRGFDEGFMGVHLPMPKPTDALKERLARLIESPSKYELRYHHFSTFHDAERRMPVVAAINVHRRYRYAELDEEGSRRDRWFRDNRIDYEVQLNAAYYANSGFDRGHLARREDAEWGYTVRSAKRAADLTCSYANAVPQVPALNRAKYGYRGEWGQLEEDLLEKGIEGEVGKAGKISVYSGPIFSDDDPVFREVKIPLSFFKVVAWYDEHGDLRTTCWRLSQRQLVSEIDFETLRFDEVFLSRQVAIAEIEEATGLEFHANLRERDTFVPPA